MKIYNYSQDTGIYIGESIADESPLEAGVYLIPANATTISPPAQQEGKTVNFENGKWTFKNIVVSEEVSNPSPLTYAQKRSREYPPITDYLDGIVKNDTEQINNYIAACLQVKEKYPK